MSLSVSAVQSPSRTHRDENFPVASRLFPARIRRQILDFYHFARTADDLADHPDLTAAERLHRLDQLDDALRHDPPLWHHHASILLQAFRQDAQVNHYANWDDLVAYCRCSAVPVGRFLLDLHNESAKCHAAADCLCIALQIINHIQDCGTDYHRLDRIYLPQKEMKDCGASESMLGEAQITPALRQVLDRMLDRVDALLQEAQPLLPALSSRRLRLEAAVTLTMAERLVKKLRCHDPLASTVRLSKTQMLTTTAAGLIRGLCVKGLP